VGALSARFFAPAQGAGFYQALLQDALALLGDGNGRTLLDVGCGPGALTRLAATRGYQATGIDNDPAMIALARRTAVRERSPAAFAGTDLHAAARTFHPADVVAAASLLAILPDPANSLKDLWECVTAKGTLLIIEPNQQMTPSGPREQLATGTPRPRRRLLAVWAHARQGRAGNPLPLDALARIAQRHDYPLLGGMITATRLEKSARTPSGNDRELLDTGTR
jgi:SAM-dependent methyltransferase